jgi:hypothetical protein
MNQTHDYGVAGATTENDMLGIPGQFDWAASRSRCLRELNRQAYEMWLIGSVEPETTVFA